MEFDVSYRLLVYSDQLAFLGGTIPFHLLARCGQGRMGVRFNSFNYSCYYVGDSISDLLLGEVWRCLAVLDSDVCIDVLSAVR